MENRQDLLFDGEDGDARAKELFELTRSDDPYPGIDSALLNSADFEAYIRATGMISPFNPSSEKVKSASYEMDLWGEMFVWQPGSCNRETFELLREGQTFDLKPNSIAFFYTRTKFRIPDYIALRFNLRIKHVHRGLLLGTGPLVDPGYEGNLLIPLHNLTNNTYKLTAGEGLIWIEFTKLSSNYKWHKNYPKYHDYEYREFHLNKKLTYVDFFEKANNGGPIGSSIPEAIKKTETDSSNAILTVNKLRKYSIWGALLAIFGIFAPTLSLILDSTSYISTAQQQLTAAQLQLGNVQKKQDELTIEYKSQQEELRKLKLVLSKKATVIGKCSPNIGKLEKQKAQEAKECPENVH